MPTRLALRWSGWTWLRPADRGNNIFIVAGEVSGDMAAASLAAEIIRLDPAATLRGIGGPRMAAAGVTILAESSTWSVIGHVDPLLRLRTHLRRLRQVEEMIRRSAPALLVLVDFAAFNLRLAELLRGAFPVVYYFPPMVSVRRGNRAAKVARLRMRLLATLRREADAYRAVGADVEFVGHPAVDVVHPTMDVPAARRRFGVPVDGPIVGLMPGSRPQEIRAHLSVMLDAARALRAARPELWFLLPVPTEYLARLVEPPVMASGLPVRVVPEIYDAMAASDVLVAATGTATLEAAVLGIPMVAVYHLPWLSWRIAKRIASVPYAALPNILAGREIVPELLQDQMRGDAIAHIVQMLLTDAQQRAAMRAALREVAADLGPPGVAARAAQHVLMRLSRAR